MSYTSDTTEPGFVDVFFFFFFEKTGGFGIVVLIPAGSSEAWLS